MAEYLIKEETLSEIADAIRIKTKGTAPLTPTEMASEIYSIESSTVTELPLGYQLKEIVPETTLTFTKGASSLIPNTPAAVVASASAVANMDVINNGESGLVVWDGVLYAVYAGQRNTPKLNATAVSTISIIGSIGNIGIPSKWYSISVVEDTRSYGASKEPFLIIANTANGFVVAIPEDSTTLTHTLQIFKFVK